MSSAYRPQGHHVLLDLYGVAAEKLCCVSTLQTLLSQAARQAGATVLHSHFHSFGSEQGVTGVLLLAESHVSIHSWPETGFVAVDIFMCGQSDSLCCAELIQTALQAQSVVFKMIERGQSGKDEDV